MKYYILFGPPGAGKGTQATAMVEKYNLHHISTGALLRKEIAAGTELGLQAKALIEKGCLVPDEVVEKMIPYMNTDACMIVGGIYTSEEKKKWWKAKDKYLTENVKPIKDNFTQISDVGFMHPSVTICPIGWGGGSVTVRYEYIDDLIEELKASKEMLEKYKKFEENY